MSTIPNPITGAVGGWWFYTHYDLAFDAQFSVPYTFEVRAPSGLIASFKSQTVDSSSGPPAPGTILTFNYKTILRYQGASGVVALEVANPITDPCVGTLSSQPVARSTRAIIWRYALVFQTSTWNGTTFLSDGYVKLYLNDNLILSATSVVIPRRFTAINQNLTFTVHIYGDTDRVWARTSPIALPVTTGGAISGAAPADLLFFDDFEGGLYPAWTFVGMAVGAQVPNAFSMVGGDSSWGLTSFCLPPTVASPCSSGIFPSNVAGLQRFFVYPPTTDLPPPPDTDRSGMYMTFTNLQEGGSSGGGSDSDYPGGDSGGGDANNPPSVPHDNYYDRSVTLPAPGNISKKIPDPTIKTALIGE